MQKNLFSLLPVEIISKIYSYTYLPQCPIHLDDIESFSRCKEVIFADYLFGFDEGQFKLWIMNDLYRFLNSYNQCLYGYSDSFYIIMTRNYTEKQKSQFSMKIFLNWLETKPITTCINILLGRMIPAERSSFIINHCGATES